MVVVILVYCVYRGFSSQLNGGVEKIKTPEKAISSIPVDPEAESRPLKNDNIMENKMKSKFETLIVVIAISVLVLVCVCILYKYNILILLANSLA